VNSVAAIAACFEPRVDIVEVDVRKTKDGQRILTHDARVDHTTDGSSAITIQTDESARLLKYFRSRKPR